MRTFAALAGVLFVATAAGMACGERPLSPGPLKNDGTRSTEFTEAHARRAAAADELVQLYCGGIESDAQRLGCLSHVSVAEVCEADTDARQRAINGYEAAYGENPCAR